MTYGDVLPTSEDGNPHSKTQDRHLDNTTRYIVDTTLDHQTY
jgi:hypothetical protein